jgi:hypothetical protein
VAGVADSGRLRCAYVFFAKGLWPGADCSCPTVDGGGATPPFFFLFHSAFGFFFSFVLLI